MPESVPPVLLYHAEAIGQVKEIGASQPLTMVCWHRAESGDILRNEFVVKFRGDAMNNQRGLAREMIASLLGQVLGFVVPTVAVVRVSKALCEAAIQWKDKLCRSVGLNFGSLLVIEPREEPEIPTSHLEAAAEVFAFDMLIQNVDRNSQKCNWFITKVGFVLFDHEKTFMCAEPLQPLGKIPEPWDFEYLNPSNHICYNALKKQTVSFDNFIGRLSRLTDSMIDDILMCVPEEWRSVELAIIRNHLILASNNADRFKRSLQEVVA